MSGSAACHCTKWPTAHNNVTKISRVTKCLTRQVHTYKQCLGNQVHNHKTRPPSCPQRLSLSCIVLEKDHSSLIKRKTTTSRRQLRSVNKTMNYNYLLLTNNRRQPQQPETLPTYVGGGSRKGGKAWAIGIAVCACIVVIIITVATTMNNHNHVDNNRPTPAPWSSPTPWNTPRPTQTGCTAHLIG